MSLRNNLIETAIRLEVIATRSAKDREKKEKVDSELKDYKVHNRNNLIYQEKTKNLIKQVEAYLAERKRKGLADIHMAIALSKEIISEGVPAELRVYEDGTAHIVNKEDGTRVTETEGSGYRGVLSLFMRERLIYASGKLNLLILDESISTLDAENTAKTSEYLKVLAENSQIILIEQKEEIRAAGGTTYRFKNINGVTYVDRERVD